MKAAMVDRGAAMLNRSSWRSSTGHAVRRNALRQPPDRPPQKKLERPEK